MINVMIVDDEYLVRERLKLGLDWQSLGCEIAAEADNGEDAMLLLTEAHIQLAIVDINMPIMDGLAFAREARITHPAVKIIILTGYGTFEYAKSALKAGTSDYLLKPVDTIELISAVSELVVGIHKETAEQHSASTIQLQLQESHSVLRNTFMRKLVTESAPLPNPEQLSLYCPELTGTSFVSIIMTIDRASTTAQPDYSNLFAVLSECFATVPGAEAFIDNDQFIVAANTGAIYTSTRMDKLLQTCRIAMNRIRNTTPFTITTGVGAVKEGIAELPVSFREASIASANKTLLGSDRIIHFNQLSSSGTGSALFAVREDMLIQLRLGSLLGTLESIHSLFEQMKDNPTTLDQLYLLLSELVAALRLYASEYRITAITEINEVFAPDSLVRKLESLNAIEAWVCDNYKEILSASGAPKRSTPALLVEKAKQFIDVSYADSTLDLNGIAASIHVNPSYLSRIFTKETGYSVVTYLTKCRMVKAKELLDNGYQNLSQVSEQIGFADPHYFSKCFKKHYGLPPSHFIVKAFLS
ncbi:response regulator [Paenibacillus alkaliterrae]|uniref:response regulator n=1 Tax=Paenibacillus alkaliterrae TaxID=320909 RepID=UPI001F41C1C6|nr:response regulator [Paenibacillus alkaliterrae]MCF2936950.1 response regulator [Paenibacillus alkaliterrae]